MRNIEFHNSSNNRIKPVFTTPNTSERVFLSAHFVFRSVFVVILLISVVLLAVQPVHSQRQAAITFGTEQVVNIFPTEVFTTQWAGVETVLIHDLSDDALYQDFNAKNSAYVPQVFVPETTPVPAVSEQATGSQEVVEENVPDPATVLENATTEGYNSEMLSAEEVAVPAEPVADEVIPEEAEPEPEQSDPVVEEVLEESSVEVPSTDESVSIINSAKSYFQGVFSLAQGVFPLAQETIVASVETESLQQPIVEESVPKTPESTPESEVVDSVVLPELAQEATPAVEAVFPEVIPTVLSSTGTQETLPDEVVGDSTAASSASESQTGVVIDPIVIATDSEVIEPANGEIYEITLANFGSAPLEPGQLINGMQLRLSFAAQLESPTSGTAPYVEVLFGQEDSLQSAGVILLDDEVSNAINGGYYLFALPAINNINKLDGVQVTLRYHGSADLLDGMFLDAVWLELDTRIITKEDLDARGKADKLVHLSQPTLNALVSDRLNFERSESPLFNLRYNSQRNSLVRGLRSLTGRDLVTVDEVNIKHNSFGLLGVVPDITVTRDGLITIDIPQDQLSKMRPGSYEIEIVLSEGGQEFVDTFNFQWGILSINPNKSEYEAGEIAQISIGALSPNGHTVCEANLDLYITDPDGAVVKTEVVESGLCDGNNVIDVPDFSAVSSTTIGGTYNLYLERLDDAGNVMSFTNDTFLVTPAQQLSIERNGPTRIYPPALYPMTLTVAVDESFTGVVTERVPKDFIISSTTADISISGDVQLLTWDKINFFLVTGGLLFFRSIVLNRSIKVNR